jgi:hypothetical protein
VYRLSHYRHPFKVVFDLVVERQAAADSRGGAVYHRQKRTWRQCYGQVLYYSVLYSVKSYTKLQHFF